MSLNILCLINNDHVSQNEWNTMEIDSNWQETLNNKLRSLMNQTVISFAEITPSKLPVESGVYLISIDQNGKEVALYVGRTKNLQQRIYNNHLMGGLSNARLKKYLINDPRLKSIFNKELAKEYIRKRCRVRWIFEKDYQKRGAYEGYFTGVLFPKYGISIEH